MMKPEQRADLERVVTDGQQCAANLRNNPPIDPLIWDITESIATMCDSTVAIAKLLLEAD